MGNLGKIAIGVALTVLVGVFFNDLLEFALLTIVCTGGVGLIGWLPAWWIIGHIVVFISDKLTSRDATVEREETTADSAETGTGMLLADYISKQLLRGELERHEITQKLVQQGWSQDDVDSAYLQAMKSLRGLS